MKINAKSRIPRIKTGFVLSSLSPTVLSSFLSTKCPGLLERLKCGTDYGKVTVKVCDGTSVERVITSKCRIG